MVVATDTSFLFSLFGLDTNTDRALKVVQRLKAPLVLSPFNEFEFGNAVRFSVFQRFITAEIGQAILADFNADKAAGRLLPSIYNLSDVLIEAERISATHTLSGGHRSFDIIHVAAANVAGADIFLTFDKNQSTLARKLGLKTA